MMFLKIERINKITVQTVYSCCPDPTETSTKYPDFAIKPNYITQLKLPLGIEA